MKETDPCKRCNGTGKIELLDEVAGAVIRTGQTKSCPACAKPPMRTCGFCGCNTNAWELRCCEAGIKAERMRRDADPVTDETLRAYQRDRDAAIERAEKAEAKLKKLEEERDDLVKDLDDVTRRLDAARIF